VAHHDYIPGHNDMPCGPRLYTFFLYLSDVEEGGGTYFTKLDMEVKPKAGRAVLWPSVKNENPMARDGRTHHEARPVIKGKKFAANAWLHMVGRFLCILVSAQIVILLLIFLLFAQYNFKDPFKVGCTG
jgi:hypothetical protein